MTVRILEGDALAMLRTLESESVQCVVTSPPYFQLRRYLAPGDPNAALEIGSELTPALFIEHLVAIFDEVRRVLTAAAVQAIRAATGTPWRAGVEVRRCKSMGDGWLAVTDPQTSEVHEIRTSDAPYGWQRRAGKG